MSAGLPLPSCCPTSCEDVPSQTIPGPAGPAGTNGTNGVDGVNSFTTVTANYVQPAVGADVTVEVLVSEWAVVGQVVYVTTGGYYTVQSQVDATHISIRNLGYAGNAAPAAGITQPQQIGPGGLAGAAGTPASNDLLPILDATYGNVFVRGQLIVDGGGNAPQSDAVLLNAGTNGQILVSLSTDPTGLDWRTVVPNAATDNAITRFDGAVGTPVPVQTSLLILTDGGALQSTPTGGDPRGLNAIDLQLSRALVTQVASGDGAVVTGGLDNTAGGNSSVVSGGQGNLASGLQSSITGGIDNTATANWSSVSGGSSNDSTGQGSYIGGGEDNTASNTHAVVSGGDTNLASGSGSAVGGGASNTASGTQSVVGGGNTNIASATLSTVAGGFTNTASAAYSSILGGRDAIARLHGEVARSSGMFAGQGDSQYRELIWRRSTTDATANVEMFLDGAALRASVPAGSTWGVSIILVGRSSAGVEAMWTANGAIHNNAGTTAVTAAFTIAVVADGTGATWGVAGGFVVNADNVNDCLHLDITGAAATNIRWTAHARIVEVNF